MAENQNAQSLPDHVQKTIADFQTSIRQNEEKIVEDKKIINNLLARYKHPAMFNDLTVTSPSPHGPIRGDEYFGQPLQTVVKEVLLRRRAANLGPATVGEIYQAMLEGGYQFDAKDEENSKRGLRISLTKNSATFAKLPQGKYGLREWYPAMKEPRARPNGPNNQKNGDPLPNPPEDSDDGFDFEVKETAGAEK